MTLGAENLSGIIPGSRGEDIELALMEKARSRRQLRKLRKQVLDNEPLKNTFGDRLGDEFDDLVARVQARSASHDFQAKIEKKTWGKWALNSAKSVALFPVRYPLWTALIAAGLIGISYYGAGSLSSGVAKLHGLVSEKVIAQLQTLDAAPGALAPGMGPGMELPGGGGSAPGFGAEGYKIRLPSSPPASAPPLPPMA